MAGNVTVLSVNMRLEAERNLLNCILQKHDIAKDCMVGKTVKCLPTVIR